MRHGRPPRRLAWVAAGLASLALPAAVSAGHAGAADIVGPSGVITAQLDSFALKVEYDIPLPVGTGMVAHVNGEARRSQAGENAKGIAGAPTEMDAVVSGKYIDPQGTGHPVRSLPQSECFYPGSLLDTHFAFPTETQGETRPAPAIGYTTSRCSAGPEVDLHARVVGSDAPGGPANPLSPVLSTGAVSSDALARPVKDTLDSTTASRASGVSILGGVVKIGSVVASGHSSTTGKPGGAASRADIAVSDIDAGGVGFSLSSATVNGKEEVQVTAGGQTFAADTSAGKAVIDAANAAIEPQGCSIAPLTSPNAYPQGFLFSRPQPDIGVKDDGTLAASYRGGLLVVCNAPRSVTDNFGGFSPERLQVLVGFAFTSTTARAQIGGYSLGDIGGAVLGAGPVLGGHGLGTLGGAVTGTGGTGGVVAAPTAGAPNLPAAPAAARPQATAAIGPFRLAPGTRWLLALLGLVGWAGLAHLGVRRFLVATTPCTPPEAGGA